MNDPMNRLKALRLFEEQGKRMDELEAAIGELGAKLEDAEDVLAALRKELTPTVELPGGDIDETPRTVTMESGLATPVEEASLPSHKMEPDGTV